MLQSEFESRVGFIVTPGDYEMIEKVYLATNEDKDAFCDMWKNASVKSRKYMLSMVAKQEEESGHIERRYNNLCQDMEEMLDLMFERAHKMSDPELRKACIKRMGRSGYIKRTLEKGYSLWEEDKKELVTILSNVIS